MNEFDFSVLTAGEPAQFGKYGSLRLRYLKENKPTLYQALLQGHIPPFDIFKKIILPLPPLKEQKRIVQEVQTIQSLISSL